LPSKRHDPDKKIKSQRTSPPGKDWKSLAVQKASTVLTPFPLRDKVNFASDAFLLAFWYVGGNPVILGFRKATPEKEQR
jgi:hypothetical protein